ncbi:MAG: penicillinase repressor [Flavobacteriaceae bacterium CG_4_8_14_3_um_filter_34_10]|nr:BlaI/MecI/CopY family transcriptional regulator [Flavobacteriia bacterium]OIP50918.1 MAG: penicillinase repressor [Flavobacteriaceae bacterium CG2_30_34_30]PIQ18151.1 MAG: penicillinase repressor [Flavobacteriaceae bacterium CG18_big_fil_WC_8_21_14_2_50_34_36]PIV48930.1 MAG: penicillinase repressor [Flavobacteriaceae bacterium CG02_land_8_20_14_3_00_34_13]PIX08714.1 MAG: penicillinase repressor [Flavobacteriaceae bacterium CG_4_8_14_3_um_filter_34_10]PIZ08290.1 MAG: penicillinase repressor 
MQLSKAEEQLMQLLWKQKRAFMKDLIEASPEPKPASTTVATLLKRMQDKGFVDYVQESRSRKYFPLIKKKDYFSKQVNGLIKNFFNNDTAQFASYFTQETNLSKKELEELRNIIDTEIKKKK